MKTLRRMGPGWPGWVPLILTAVGAQSVSSAGDPSRLDFHSVVQTGSPWTPGTHLGTDLAMVVGDESERGWKGAAEKVRTWRERGYRTYGFASIARVYDYYMRGGWTDLSGRKDPGGHEGEIQRDRWGEKFGPHEFMLQPSARLTEHKKLWARAFVDAGVEGMVFEEPDVFMDGGYSLQFRREWQARYGEPWRPPDSSIEARVKSEKLKAELGFRGYRDLSAYCKERARGQGRNLKFVVASHSLPNYLLWGITFDYFRTLSLPTVDTLQAQVWTGTAKTPILFEGERRERLFDNAFLDYSYSVNLAEALGKSIVLNLDPYEDEPGLPFEFYRRGFENTLVASLMFPQASTWEILPWPDRIYTNGRIPHAYGTEIQNVLSAMSDLGRARQSHWETPFPRTGILFSETALYEARDPSPSNPQNLFALAEPLLSAGVPVDVVPLEAVQVRKYLDRFKVLFLSYDSWKPAAPELHLALAGWVRRGGSLVVIGGRSAYDAAPLWWHKAGHRNPTGHLFHTLGLAGEAPGLQPVRPSDIRPVAASPESGLAARFAGFWAGLRGSEPRPRASSFVPDGRGEELNYLESAIGPGDARRELRFADASGFFIYRFATMDLERFTVKADLANGYVVEASSDGKTWMELAHSVKALGREVRDGSNRTQLSLDLTPLLGGKEIRLRFRDPSPRDGWGPTLRRLTLAPVYRGAPPVSTAELPLSHRDGYCALYRGLNERCRPAIRASNGDPIVFSAAVEKGLVIGIGASPALFGSSRSRAGALQSLYRDLCVRRGLKLRASGVLHHVRGDYHLVYPISRETRLAGRYLDILSPELDVLTNPRLELGRPYLLRSLVRARPGDAPRLLFASHRMSPSAAKTGERVYTLNGPAGIPGAARFWIGPERQVHAEARRVKDGAPVPCDLRVDPDGTARVRTTHAEGGVRMTLRESRPAR